MKHLRNKFAGRLLFLLCPAYLLGQGLSPCDLTGNGSVDSADVSLAVNMATGQTTCSSRVLPSGACDAVVVQRVVNAANGGTCAAGNLHSVTVNWVAPASAAVVGYNVYRATTSGGPYVQISASLVNGTSYQDTGLAAGRIYYYVVTSVGINGAESSFSTEVPVTIPFP